MSGLNKRALYQMATSNSSSNGTDSAGPQPVNGNSLRACPPEAEFTMESVQFMPVCSSVLRNLPDGRLSQKLSPTPVAKPKSSDAVSLRARVRINSKTPHDIKRADVLKKLGCGSLGLLTSAYLEQQVMSDDEIHTVQQRFYGLHSV